MLTLPRSLTFTPSQFAQVCAANPEAVLELAADGTLIEMTPTGGASGSRNQTLGALLWLAIEQGRLPLKLFDSSTGFLLPVAARLLRRSWLGAQPRRQRGAAGSLAGVERDRAGGLCAFVPGSRGGAGQPFR
jgi:Uma2 family endonuclease